MEDFKFSKSDLVDGKLFIANMTVGGITIQTHQGYLVIFEQYSGTKDGVQGMYVDFQGVDMGDNEWIAHYVDDLIGAIDDGTTLPPNNNLTTQYADFKFSKNDLVDGKLFIANMTVGGVSIQDENGYLVMIDQYSGVKDGVSGIYVDFQGVDMGDNEWTVHYVDEYVLVNSGDNNNQSSSSSNNEGGNTNSPDNNETETTGDLIHQYIEPIIHDINSINYIVNELVYPQIWMFCEIQVWYQVGAKLRDGSYKFTYPNWNSAYEPEVFLNGSDTQLNSDLYEVNYKKGIIKPKFETAPGDNMMCSYNFSWFNHETLASFVQRSIGTINYHGQGATTSYTVKDLPEGFYGISADLCVAMAMENLLLSTTMWLGKLIFAISSNDLYNGGGDIASQLETIKRNCEDRAYSSLENERMRAPNALAKPTPAYWRSVTMGTGIRPGPHGQWGYGKTRGIKINKLAGLVGPDTGNVDLGI